MLELELERGLAAFDLHVRLEVGDDILALFGPSGAGKSMLLKMLAGIEQPRAGMIRLAGRVLYDATTGVNLPARLRRVGYVPQHYALFPHLTALENVAFPLRTGLRPVSAEIRARARGLLEMVGLGNHLDAYPRALSGGQQQRVALARALASDPALLLLDEPFAALDTPVRVDMRRELRDLQRRVGIPTIFVTHDLEEAATVAGRMAVLIDGRLRQVGSVHDVVDRPADVDVARLVQAENIIPGVAARRPDGVEVRCDAGTVLLRDRSIADGAKVWVIVRPEHIRFGGLGQGASTRVVEFAGRVVERRDTGLRVLLVVCTGQTTLCVAAPPGDAGHAVALGAEVRLVVDERDVHLIAVDGISP